MTTPRPLWRGRGSDVLFYWAMAKYGCTADELEAYVDNEAQGVVVITRRDLGKVNELEVKGTFT